MTLKLVANVAPQTTDEDKRIEETTSVEQKSTFTISQLKGEIENCDVNIARQQAEKEKLEAKITAAVSELKLTINSTLDAK